MTPGAVGGLAFGKGLVLLFIGLFIDLTPAVIMMVPILLPLAHRLDLDLIHLGVIGALPLTGFTHLVIDVGGGSTEVIVGAGSEPRLLSPSRSAAFFFARP